LVKIKNFVSSLHCKFCNSEFEPRAFFEANHVCVQQYRTTVED